MRPTSSGQYLEDSSGEPSIWEDAPLAKMLDHPHQGPWEWYLPFHLQSNLYQGYPKTFQIKSSSQDEY